MKRLEGKVAVITGAASGIGLGAVELFVQEGARVVAADMQDAKGTELERRFPDLVRYAHCDVTREADVEAAIGQAAREFGGLDILFNNAGTSGSALGVDTMTLEAWNEVFALHVAAPMLGMKHATPLMIARGGGSIINNASIAALQTGYGPYAYSAAKAAVVQMGRWAVSELSKHGIRVNTICPGMIATSIYGVAVGLSREEADDMAADIAHNAPRFQPLKMAGMPRDIAEAVLYFASDAARFVTGVCMQIDGGVTIGPPGCWDPEQQRPISTAFAEAAAKQAAGDAKDAR